MNTQINGDGCCLPSGWACWHGNTLRVPGASGKESIPLLAICNQNPLVTAAFPLKAVNAEILCNYSPIPNFNGDSTKQRLNVWYWLIITSHTTQWVWLLIHVWNMLEKWVLVMVYLQCNMPHQWLGSPTICSLNQDIFISYLFIMHLLNLNILILFSAFCTNM